MHTINSKNENVQIIDLTNQQPGFKSNHNYNHNNTNTNSNTISHPLPKLKNTTPNNQNSMIDISKSPNQMVRINDIRTVQQYESPPKNTNNGNTIEGNSSGPTFRAKNGKINNSNNRERTTDNVMRTSQVGASSKGNSQDSKELSELAIENEDVLHESIAEASVKQDRENGTDKEEDEDDSYNDYEDDFDEYRESKQEFNQKIMSKEAIKKKSPHQKKSNKSPKKSQDQATGESPLKNINVAQDRIEKIYGKPNTNNTKSMPQKQSKMSQPKKPAPNASPTQFEDDAYSCSFNSFVNSDDEEKDKPINDQKKIENVKFPPPKKEEKKVSPNIQQTKRSLPKKEDPSPQALKFPDISPMKRSSEKDNSPLFGRKKTNPIFEAGKTNDNVSPKKNKIPDKDRNQRLKEKRDLSVSKISEAEVSPIKIYKKQKNTSNSNISPLRASNEKNKSHNRINPKMNDSFDLSENYTINKKEKPLDFSSHRTVSPLDSSSNKILRNEPFGGVNLNMVSIATFDPEDKTSKIDSPRSVHAMKKLGVLQDDLYIMTKSDISKILIQKKEFEKANDKEYLELKTDHQEKKRKQLVEKIANIRKLIIDDEVKSITSSIRSLAFVPPSRGTNSSILTAGALLRRDQKELEILERKNKKEVEEIIHLQKYQNQYLTEEEIRNQQRKQRQSKLQKMLAQHRKKDEMKKKLKAIEEEEEAKKLEDEKAKIMENMQKHEEKLKKENIKKEKERKEISKLRQETRRKKKAKIEQMSEIELEEKRLKYEEKERKLKEKEKFRTEKYEKYIKEKKRKEQELENFQKENYQKIIVQQEQDREFQRLMFEEKMKRIDQKKKTLDKIMNLKKEESQKKFDFKVREIEKIKQEKQKQADQLKQQMEKEERELLERLKETESNRIKMLNLKKEEKTAKNQRLKEESEKKELILKEKINKFNQKLADIDRKAIAAYNCKLSEIKKQHKMRIIKREDYEENLLREERKKQYENELIREKMILDDRKNERMKKEKEALSVFRQKMRKQLLQEKHALKNKFEGIQKNYINKTKYLNSFEKKKTEISLYSDRIDFDSPENQRAKSITPGLKMSNNESEYGNSLWMNYVSFKKEMTKSNHLLDSNEKKSIVTKPQNGYLFQPEKGDESVNKVVKMQKINSEQSSPPEKLTSREDKVFLNRTIDNCLPNEAKTEKIIKKNKKINSPKSRICRSPEPILESYRHDNFGNIPVQLKKNKALLPIARNSVSIGRGKQKDIKFSKKSSPLIRTKPKEQTTSSSLQNLKKILNEKIHEIENDEISHELNEIEKNTQQEQKLQFKKIDVDNCNLKGNSIERNKSSEKLLNRKKHQIQKLKNREEESLKKIEELKIKQNNELRKVLIEEEAKEKNRNEIVKQETNIIEKRKLEKQFSIERAQANVRITKLSHEQEKEMQNLLKDL